MVFVPQLALVVIAVFAVVVYRVAVYAVLSANSGYNMGAVNMATSGTAVLSNLQKNAQMGGSRVFLKTQWDH